MERFQEYYTMKDLSKVDSKEELVDDVLTSLREDYNRQFGTEYKTTLLSLRKHQAEVVRLEKELEDKEYNPPVFLEKE
jgi:hypothetical protein